MIETIFSTITDAVEGMAGALSSAVTSVVSLFWTPGSGSDPGSFTFLGILTLVGLGAGLVYFGLRFIIRAVRGVA